MWKLSPYRGKFKQEEKRWWYPDSQHFPEFYSYLLNSCHKLGGGGRNKLSSVFGGLGVCNFTFTVGNNGDGLVHKQMCSCWCTRVYDILPQPQGPEMPVISEKQKLSLTGLSNSGSTHTELKDQAWISIYDSVRQDCLTHPIMCRLYAISPVWSISDLEDTIFFLL